MLRERATADEFGAYVWLAFACASETPRHPDRSLLAPTDAVRDVPLIAFKRAICRGVRPEPLRALLERDPRFVETKYLLGSYDVGLMTSGQDKLDEADRLFNEAYAWHAQWPAVTQSIANVAMTVEEFERAALFYDRTLALEPLAVDALLGKARALTYLGKPIDAIATTDQLLAARWFVGDARYWRALNESELERNDDAWIDVELADKLLVNADVPKLAGLIAYRRRELDLSRGKFELARKRNTNDCETVYTWASFSPNSACGRAPRRCCSKPDSASRTPSADTPRRSRRFAHRTIRRSVRRRRLRGASSTSPRDAACRRHRWFDIAVAYYNLSRKEEARQFAEKVAGDEQFGERAKEILARLAKSPQP